MDLLSLLLENFFFKMVCHRCPHKLCNGGRDVYSQFRGTRDTFSGAAFYFFSNGRQTMTTGSPNSAH